MLSGTAPDIMPVVGGKKGPEQAVFLVEGAHWTMLVLKRLVAFIIMGVTALSAGTALAATAGQPEPWQLGLQKGVTPVMDDIIWFHDLLLWLITAIALFVLAL
ncbi:MAG: cytochrome c oxidase subunit II transmembrane domain-containing protein, partial [Pseudolabrys sp.]